VRSEPALDGIVTARGDTLCLDGLKHGETYQIELLAGFPAASGETMPETFRGGLSSPTASRRSALLEPAMYCRAREAPDCR